MTQSTCPTTILFVCMGNICRSPLAEGLFLHKVNRRSVADRFDVDSAGTGQWHVGEPPDERAVAIAARHHVVLPSRARQVCPADFSRFDHLICMDEDNREDLLALGAPEARLKLLLEIDPQCPIRDVPDPYYSGADGFATVYRLIDNACEALIEEFVGPTS